MIRSRELNFTSDITLPTHLHYWRPLLKTRSLVTGGAGFIGSHLVDSLLADNHDVVVLDDLSGGFRDNVPAGSNLVVGSCCDERLVRELFEKHRFQYVFHLAAYAAEGLSHFIRNFNYSNNVLGSVNLINSAIEFDVKCFVFTSSIAVYGSAQMPATEAMTPIPEDPYGVAKYAVELDLRAALHHFGLPYIVFRPHNVYGTRQNTGDPFRNVVGIFMRQMLLGEPITIFGDGSQTRAFTDIADVAPVIARSIQNQEAFNKVFNIGADDVCSVAELAEHAQRAMNCSTQILHLPPRNEVQHAFSDHGLARQILQYEPKISLAAGLERMANWVKSVGVRKTSEFPAVELDRGLPESWRAILKAAATTGSSIDHG